ncbi:MAG: polysaccharide deacetylase family protein [Polyangiaceae bacterium]|nr:polysaccharide deacetylase family protein [Polyangiaceae bacterium]
MKRVTLTFDNGPHAEVTPRILDVLGERAVPAHFFVLGRELASPVGRALVRRAIAEGHRVGNHSFSHETPLGEDPRASAVELEIGRTEALLTEIAPAEPRRFRPFGGGGVIGPHLLSSAAAQYLEAHGYTCVLWSSVPRDWVDPQGWSERALADCASRGHSVVVLHDVQGACLDALPGFIDALRARGFELSLELPRDCTPIVDGRALVDLRPFVTA